MKRVRNPLAASPPENPERHQPPTEIIVRHALKKQRPPPPMESVGESSHASKLRLEDICIKEEQPVVPHRRNIFAGKKALVDKEILAMRAAGKVVLLA